MLRFSHRKVKAALLGCLLLLGATYIGGCGISTPSEPPPEQRVRTLKGVSLSPLSFQSNDFTDFFKKAKQAGDIVSWAGDWNDLNNADNGAKVVAELAATYGYSPLIELQFFTQSTGVLLRPLDDSAEQAYINSAVAFNDKYRLNYLGIGIEVNTLHAKSPADFDAFVQFFNRVFDAIKAKSPETKVFTIFQLEMMKGLNGGLFGGANDPSRAQWSMLDLFPKSDIIAFTTYPGLIYKSPSEIPPEYYEEVRTHTSKPIAFTEIGWQSEAGPPGWESSDSLQSQFVDKFWALSQNIKEELAVWTFLYDQNTVVPFRSMGLYRRDGSAKTAWKAWLDSG